MAKPRFLLLILLLAAAFRFYGLDWDDGIGAHPDERYVVSAAERLHWPDLLNPFAVASRFAYGHLPLYLLSGALSLSRNVDPLLLGRMLAALFDLGAVALTFLLGRQVYEENVGLLAAAFVALMLLHVQHSHFYTVDLILTFFVLGALLFAVRLAVDGRRGDAWAAGVWAGLALGAKFSAALLALPLGAACALAPAGQSARWRRGLEIGAVTLAAFMLTNPYACLNFPIFWRNLSDQAAMARGLLEAPYTRQFHVAWPYLYPILQQLRWGMGWPLGLVICGGLVYAVWRAVQEPPRPAEWVLLAWIAPAGAFWGALYAKFPRYLLPLTPALAICAARLLVVLHRRNRHWAFWFLACFSLGGSLLYCFAFVNLYHTPHPWQSASTWFYEHAPRGAVVAVEQWDHPLPLNSAGYEMRELPIFDEDTLEKWARMDETLAEADYVIVASRRGYAALARWPERYPRTTRYYRRLFEGRRGFEPVACLTRHPHLGPLVLLDDPTAGIGFSLPELCLSEAPLVLRLGRLDESFVVYDHPQVMIMRSNQSASVTRR